jgi:hypothetical protein
MTLATKALGMVSAYVQNSRTPVGRGALPVGGSRLSKYSQINALVYFNMACVPNNTVCYVAELG